MAYTTIYDIPDKLLFEIFTHLDQQTFLVASEVCHLWNNVIEKNLDFFVSWFAEDEVRTGILKYKSS